MFIRTGREVGYKPGLSQRLAEGKIQVFLNFARMLAWKFYIILLIFATKPPSILPSPAVNNGFGFPLPVFWKRLSPQRLSCLTYIKRWQGSH